MARIEGGKKPKLTIKAPSKFFDGGLAKRPEHPVFTLVVRLLERLSARS